MFLKVIGIVGRALYSRLIKFLKELVRYAKEQATHVPLYVSLKGALSALGFPRIKSAKKCIRALTNNF